MIVLECIECKSAIERAENRRSRNNRRLCVQSVRAAAMTTRAPVLNVYKNLLKLARSLPLHQREESILRIRNEFRANAGASAEQIDEMLRKANSSLGYLKIVTPRKQKSQTGVTKIVFGNDKEGGTTKKAMSNWTASNMDPDSVKRHFAGLKRAGFSGNRDVVGGMF